MKILNFLKKKEVPNELPDLVTDEIEQKIKDENTDSSSSLSEKGSENVDSNLSVKTGISEKKNVPVGKSDYLSSNSGKEDEEIDYAKEVKRAVLQPKVMQGKSFFSELQKNLSEGLSHVNDLDEQYYNKFLSKDILKEMKDYWEDKKTTTLLQALGDNFREKINEKTETLQKLEKEWQDVYFDLVEKEAEIKEEEEELKKMLSEFMEVWKKRKINLNENDQKKTKEKEHK